MDKLCLSCDIFNLIIIVGGIFAFIASIMAYLITYDEYIHHYQSAKKPIKYALQAAIFTFVLFCILTVGAGYFLSLYIVTLRWV
ncbi:MAG: hypothetical protein EVG15_08850 [Candidatus Acididesulfobacter diazotrophicus]|uniref:Uncharacterized protein n=1 Tax=Candidatus Acididesulfobacter diazotrophicus TaxID=2597226 RepID=A0A519BKV2_9DELT|nr:MAG: hypothetical protein EVG15_08850 [Candidatus Acididesulfobacter diazotrophicus]